MKIKLIAPHDETLLSSAEDFKFRRLNLPLLAGLTPSGHTVTIVDEAFAPDHPEENIDLVGVTVMTDLALRAYRIADGYRQRGVRVVMGGIHPTVLPGEALRHADAVVIGEAETVWPQVLSDAASGRLREVYPAGQPAELRNRPGPRWDLYPKPVSGSYTPIPTSVETSRGCPFDCEFCSISTVTGRQCRFRPVPEVVAEITAMESPYLFFVDDTLGLNRPLSKELFRALIPLRRIWAGQGGVALAEDLELLKLMKRSGCVGLLIGFESVQKKTHSEMRKTGGLKIDFPEAMRRFHGEGLTVLGAFIFGLDHEDRDVFDQTFEFIMKCRLDCAELRILTPFPGTRLYSRLLSEGRLFEPRWWLRGCPPDTLLFRPKGMSPESLIEGFDRLTREVYSAGAIIKRFFGMTPWKRSAIGCRAYAGFNLGTRKRYLESLGIPQPFVQTSRQAERDGNRSLPSSHPSSEGDGKGEGGSARFIMSETFPFVEHFPYLGIFLLLLLGTLGGPFPEDTTLMLSGFLVTRDVIRLIPTLTVVYPTLLLTDLFLYGLGRRYGRRILEHHRFKKVLSVERLHKMEEGFGKWGIWLILTGRQLPVLRSQVLLVSGIMGMRFTTFFMADAVSALITIAIVGGMGGFVGEGTCFLVAMILVTLALFTGCSFRQVAVNKLGDALSKEGTVYATDDDPELIKGATPFSLKLMESLLAESPRHRGLLLAACRGFTQYGYVFVQMEADQIEEADLEKAMEMRQRSRRLYLRARNYGLRGLDVIAPGFERAARANPGKTVQAFTVSDVALLYWTAVSWTAAVSVAKDNSDLISDLPVVDALLDRALELDEAFDSGAIHSFLIAYEMGRGTASGNPEQRARSHFQRAVQLSGGQLSGPFVTLAESVSLPNQDKEEFKRLLEQALKINPDERPEWRMANLTMQRRARWLLGRTDKLFVD